MGKIPLPLPSSAVPSEPGWHDVASLDEVGAAMPRRVVVDGEGVLLCRDGAHVFALTELCPHKGLSMAYGVVFDGALICPHHQYRFQLADGRCNQRRCEPVQTWDARIVEGRVWVRRPGTAPTSVPGQTP